nr:uncharacterized protein LOC116770880 [Danaus plexippus plexippus]
MSNDEEKYISVAPVYFEESGDNSIEVIRKCNTTNNIDTSWDQSNYVSFKESKESQREKTPPYYSIMIDASPSDSRSNSSTQTDIVGPVVEDGLVDVNLSFSKDFNAVETSSNDSDDVLKSLGSKRYRHDSFEEKVNPPWKKTKCTGSSTSSSSDLTEPKAAESVSSNKLCSESDVSFKSINTNYSYKVRKRRKSDSNLFKDMLHRSRKCSSLGKCKYLENNISGGTPRKDKSYRRSNRTKVWNIVDICTWIGRKGYQSITGLYSDIVREPITLKENKDSMLMEEVKVLKNIMEEIDSKQARLARENELLKEQMKNMLSKIVELENKLSRQPIINIIPFEDNPVRPKRVQKDTQQPLVTQHMLEATRARLGRNRPVAASTPKQQLSELEKCLLQESSVTSLYRRRVTRGTFRSAEELRVRPYPTRCARSPHSPRSNSLSRATTSPLKFPLICPNKENTE